MVGGGGEVLGPLTRFDKVGCGILGLLPPWAVDTGVTRGTGETVEGGVDGLDGLRLGKYEKWCLNCKMGIPRLQLRI